MPLTLSPTYPGLPTARRDPRRAGLRPDVEGPKHRRCQGGSLDDVTSAFPTLRDLCETCNLAKAVRLRPPSRWGRSRRSLYTPPQARDPRRPWLMSPIDLQAIKAVG